MNIDKSVTVRGSFQVEGDLHVEGTLEGKVFVTGRLVLERTGVLTGDARCSGGRVAGKLSGILHSDEPIVVDPGAVVAGRIVAPALDFGGTESFEGARDPGSREQAQAPAMPQTPPPSAAPARRPALGSPSARVRRPPTVTGDRSQVVVTPGSILENRT